MSGMEEVAPLLKLVYQEALINQLNDSIAHNVLGNFKRSPEEQKQYEEWKAKHERERKELLDLLATATGTVKAIVELHAPDKYGDECTGCDYGGYEGDMPGWPCRTIDLIAEELRGKD